MPAQVVGERRHRLIALARGLLEGLAQDHVEVARQPSSQWCGRRGARRPRFLLDYGAGMVERRGEPLAGRMGPGQQPVEQHAQRVDVGGGGERLATDLFRRREFRGQRPGHRDASGRARAVAFEQLGDAEVEERDVSGRIHQDVRRLDVAVNHQVRVRVRHGVADLQDDCEPGLDVETGALGVLVDPLAFDQLKN